MQTTAKPTVLVMMATYNGESYLVEQIDSILGQTDVCVTLLISDDGSTDGTCGICERYANKFPNVIFRRNPANKGLAKNFMDMVYNQDSQSFDYYAFSDQDDFWLSEKLSCAIRAIQDSEATCCLYYSDVCNVDENLNGGINEFKVFAQVATSFCTLLTVNWASGCTMVFDRNLHQLLKTYHPEAYTRNHDAWINLIALSCGKVVPDLEHSYIKRRISEKNQVGEREFGKFDALRIQGAFNAFLHPTHYGTKCATELLNGYSELMSPAACKSAEQFIASKTSFACRIKVAFNKDYCFPYRIDRLAHIAKALLGLY